ncbi:hypothetical protein DYB37_004538 [Aphanomyces astaci]|uniref:Trs120/TRAPPC9 N-terminal domain-containing protein n=1 Tax=Aphanomyces astaci TaxID=112090 RepID=A0A3R7AP66_APHAT|nr:hypothetical protein DYB35_004815 [Aphanomyces astaci]RHZ31680.1 hypothetical protein DYB37_004538 [Aphanomyces astaci]
MPVGNIPRHMYMEGIRMLQASAVITMSSLTRPGGYSAELSPFRALSWDSATSIVYRFEDTLSQASSSSTLSSASCDEVHAWNRPLGVIGLCHCPSTADLRDAYADFKRAALKYPSAIIQKVYAFEHAFGAGTLEDVSALDDLVMFPLAAPLSDGHTTVSLHLQVVLDAMTVTILMSLESTVRGVLRQHQQQAGAAIVPSADLSESGFGLLSTQVDPPATTSASPAAAAAPIHSPAFLGTSSGMSTPAALRTGSGNSTLLPRPSGVTTTASAMDLSERNVCTTHALVSRKQMPRSNRSRQEKLVADYALVVGCVPDAVDYYTTAIDGLRDDEKKSAPKSGTNPADGLWLGAALEGYVTALYLTMQRQKVDKAVVGGNGVKLNVEMIEKASEAIAWYAKVGCVALEANLVTAMGWYYTELVDDDLVGGRGGNRRRPLQRTCADEAEWIRRLCIETHHRLLLLGVRNAELFPNSHTSSQVSIKHVLAVARQSRRIGYTRKELLYVLDASALLCLRSRSRMISSSSSPTMDLHAAYVLVQQVLHGLATPIHNPQSSGNASDKERGPVAVVGWSRLRFYVLRHLIGLARKLHRPHEVAKHTLALLDLLVHDPTAITACDDAAAGSATWNEPVFSASLHIHVVDTTGALKTPLIRGGLHTAPTVYATPPPSMEKEVKKAAVMLLQHSNSSSLLSSSYFKHLPLLTSTTGTNPPPPPSSGSTTPRQLLLSTPRQLMSAVLSNTSTPSSAFFDASDVAAVQSSPQPTTHIPVDTATTTPSIKHPSSDTTTQWTNPVQEWQHACWRLLHDDTSSTNSRIDLPLTKLNGLIRIERFQVGRRAVPTSNAHATTTSGLRRLDAVLRAVQRKSTAPPPNPSTFFYNPFQAKGDAITTNNNTTTDDENDTMYPVHASIDLEMVVHNPTDIDVLFPHVAAWVAQGDPDDSSTIKAQCPPVVLQLTPRQSNITTRLTVRPTHIGPMVVLGCLLRLKHQTLRYKLERPVVLEIVPALPTLAFRPSPATASSMFQHQLHRVSVDVINPSGLCASHLFMDMTIVVHMPPSHAKASTATILLVNSLQLDTADSSSSSAGIHKVTVAGGVDVVCTLPPGFDHIQLRALCCHSLTHQKLYRETAATVSITCEPAVCITALAPLFLAGSDGQDGCISSMWVAELWNPSPSVLFHVHIDGELAANVPVPPLCVRRMLLPSSLVHTPFTWTTPSSGASGAIPTPDNTATAIRACPRHELPMAPADVPWTLHVALGQHASPLMLTSMPLHEFFQVVVHVMPRDRGNQPTCRLPLLLSVQIHVLEQVTSVGGGLELSPTTNMVVAGQLAYQPSVEHPHVVQVMAMTHGVYCIRCVGMWAQGGTDNSQHLFCKMADWDAETLDTVYASMRDDISSTKLRFPASKVAAIIGLHEYGDPDLDDLLALDASVLHMEVTTKDAELDALIRKSGADSALNTLLQWTSDTRTTAKVNHALGLSDNAKSVIDKACKKNKLTTAEAKTLHQGLASKVWQSVGKRNDVRVHSTNDKLYYLYFPHPIQAKALTTGDLPSCGCRQAIALEHFIERVEVDKMTSSASVGAGGSQHRTGQHFSICGMIDGVADVLSINDVDDTWSTELILVEVKNRMRQFRHPVPLYDVIQMAVYMKMLGVRQGDMVQCIHQVILFEVI